METWPKDFRLPEWDNYSVNAHAQIVRTPFDSGYARQRKLRMLMPEQYNVTFVFHVRQWGLAQRWMRDIGYDWFLMPVANMVSSIAGERCKEQIVRFIADLEIAPRGRDYIEIKTTMELHPDSFLEAGLANTDWIIAGEPDNPATDTIIAGEPDNPSDPDTVVAGTPGNPAAHT